MPTSMIKTEVIYYLKKTLRPGQIRASRKRYFCTSSFAKVTYCIGKVLQCCMFLDLKFQFRIFLLFCLTGASFFSKIYPRILINSKRETHHNQKVKGVKLTILRKSREWNSPYSESQRSETHTYSEIQRSETYHTQKVQGVKLTILRKSKEWNSLHLEKSQRSKTHHTQKVKGVILRKTLRFLKLRSLSKIQKYRI
jgi:hypothetical protein